MVSKQQLAIQLSKLAVFSSPNVLLEQYPTDSDVAASILWEMHMRAELEGKCILDLGAGTGILGIGCLLLDADHVTFVETDAKVLQILQQNLDLHEIEKERYTIVAADVLAYNGHADVVIQNPPFGTRSKHADLIFLERALALAPIVYSLHKTSTKTYVVDWVSRHGAQVTHSWEFSFPLKQTLRQHTRKLQRIDVCGLRVAITK